MIPHKTCILHIPAFVYLVCFNSQSILQFDHFRGIIFCPVLISLFYFYIYIVRAAITLDYYSVGVCCIRKREHDMKDINIVDSKPERKYRFGHCISLFSP